MGGRLMLLDSTTRRSEGRFFINSDATKITVNFAREDGEDVVAHGRLADLSLHGLKICVDKKIEDDQLVDLVIEVPTLDFRVERKAIVRWQHPRDTGSWWTGCELREAIDDELIQKLATAHVLNRRRDPRYSVDRPATVRWELSDKMLEARLVNFSKGGFCFVIPAPTDFPSDRLMLALQDRGREIMIPARVMWKGPLDNEYAIGCAFSTLDGFVKIRECVNQGQPRNRHAIQRNKRALFWLVFAVFVLGVLQFDRQIRNEPNLFVSAASAWNQLASDWGLPELPWELDQP